MRYSVIATTYNDEESIEKYLNDIILQTIKPYEVIIADGGSRDNTVSIIKKFNENSDINIKVVTKGRLNISEGYNLAIENCSTSYIGITGIGNRYDRKYFELLINEIGGDKEIVYSPIRGCRDNKFSCIYNDLFLDGENGNVLDIGSNHGALIKKEVFEKVGKFYEKFIYAGEDAEFYTRVKEMNINTKCVKQAKAYWEIPRSYKEYLKQVKNYTIADMQLNSNINLIKKFIKPILSMVILMILMLLNWKISIVYLLIILIVFFSIAIKRSSTIYGGVVFMTSKYAPIFYIIKYIKYLSPKYKVRSEK